MNTALSFLIPVLPSVSLVILMLCMQRYERRMNRERAARAAARLAENEARRRRRYERDRKRLASMGNALPRIEDEFIEKKEWTESFVIDERQSE